MMQKVMKKLRRAQDFIAGSFEGNKSKRVVSAAKADDQLVLTVSLNGKAMYNSVQKAVDAAPSSSTSKTILMIDSGTYTEKVIVPAEKNNLVFQGKGYVNTVIQWHDRERDFGHLAPSASVAVKASNFIAYDISFQNTAPAPAIGEQGGQAVALNIEGDKGAFYRCGFYGNQDTLLDNKGRHYFKDCYIEGTVDFICGNGKSLYEGCTIHSVVKEGGLSGFVTAQQRHIEADKTGYSFVNCRVEGTGKVYLGRPWDDYSTVVFCKTNMSDVVEPQGWTDWKPEQIYRQKTVFYGEFMNNGPGANSSARVSYEKRLSQEEAAPFLTISYIDGDEWLPRLGSSSSSSSSSLIPSPYRT